MIPVRGRIGETEFTTSLWPKDGGYVVPVKDAVRKPEHLELGDVVDRAAHRRRVSPALVEGARPSGG